ncbi:MAG: hypothetical protein J2P36_17075 [Ktedonobacteraceae bacterium]|nr:hypothetical protein [Ktedonobacteraceae bacterium]
MMKKLRGRNLAHPGCLIGLTVGLILGIIIAGLMAWMLNPSLNILMLVWLVIAFGLAAAGWIIGDRLSSRFPVLEEETDEQSRE